MRRGLVLLLLLSSASLALAQGPKSTAKPAAHPAAPPYNAYVHTWHQPTPGHVAPVDAGGKKKLVLMALNTQERVELSAEKDSGAFSAHELDRAAHLLREPSSGNEHPIEPRVLDAVYRIQVHFDAQEIRIISGYRTPHGGASNHGKGRAIDVVVPGATDDDVAKFAREMGFMGVGIYPQSGFVHVDVRERSYFWIDSSGPGKKNRERGILGDVASRADAAALARGEHGLGALSVGTDVDALLRQASPGGPSLQNPPPALLDDDTDEP